MTSLFGSMVGAAANAIEGAAIGRAIGGANQRANQAEGQTELWYDHAKKIEVMVLDLREKLKNSERSRNELSTKLEAAEKQLARFKGVVADAQDKMMSNVCENINYGREIKKRLRQMEKGLQHSSADAASLNYVLGVYKELFGDFSVLSSNGTISPEAKDTAEKVWTSFMNGEKLTDNKAIQEIIDLAPMPMKTPAVII
jgi:predicted RNase H-like nuclease (RuvC/YqgF family)